MIDLHCHILPAIDDGAADLDTALAMCRLAAQDGCTAMVATPHLRHELWQNADRDLIEQLFHQVRSLTDGLIEVFLGGEIAVNSESAHEMSSLPDGDLIPLASSRYLLLEFHPRGMGPDPEELIHELIVGGWWPVIAHPERIAWLANDPAYLAALLEQGALSQITATSLTQDAGRFTSDAATHMLDAGMVHFVASDAHDTARRPPGLSRAYRLIAGAHGEALARKLLITNPRAVLENRRIDEIENGESTPTSGTRPGSSTPLHRTRGRSRRRLFALGGRGDTGIRQPS